MSLKKPIRSISPLIHYLSRICVMRFCCFQLKTRFLIILNNFYNSISPDTPFEYDVLYIYIILPAKFIRILPWRCGEITSLSDDIGGI